MFDFAKSEKLKPDDLKPSEPTETSDYTTYGMTETCNNCVHYEACKAMYQIAYKDFNNYTFIRACELYKSAADVVEVVRCKDCKCYKEYLHHSTQEPTGWGKCAKIEMDIDLAANDYCSYGERRDT